MVKSLGPGRTQESPGWVGRWHSHSSSPGEADRAGQLLLSSSGDLGLGAVGAE